MKGKVPHKILGLDGRPMGSKRATAPGLATELAMAWKRGEPPPFHVMTLSHGADFEVESHISERSQIPNDHSLGTRAAQWPSVLVISARETVGGASLKACPWKAPSVSLVLWALAHLP